MVVLPVDTPVTTPPLTVAMAVDALLQVPPEMVSIRVVVAPVQLVVEPVIVPATGVGLTVKLWLAATVPQLLVTE